VSFWRRLNTFENDIDFRKGWRVGLIVSLVLVLVSILSFATRGLNLGIDFEGGVVWEVPANGVSVAKTRDALRPLGLSEAKIQILGSNIVRVQAGPKYEKDAKARDQVITKLASLAQKPKTDVSYSTVGPSWGSEITSKAVRALVFFFVALAIYMAWRLEWRMSVAALIAVIHDIILSVGVYSVFHFDVTPATVIAFLTILGFSLYDTIVVFDKAQENAARLTSSGRMTYTDLMNLSLNQTIMRSINTTVAAVLPVVAMLIVGAWGMGAVTLEEFSIALLVGMLSGAYSSVFLAAPITVWLKEKEPRNRQIRQRMEAQGLSKDRLLKETEMAPVGVAAGGDGGGGKAANRPAPRPSAGARTHPPRPRKKSKRR
jgi:preprotein translocase subunit SecF